MKKTIIIMLVGVFAMNTANAVPQPTVGNACSGCTWNPQTASWMRPGGAFDQFVDGLIVYWKTKF